MDIRHWSLFVALLVPCAARNVGDMLRHCKVSTMGGGYTGPYNITITGKTCQAWSSQEPHSHPWGDAVYFPDNTLEEISNGCRNPDDYDGGEWCYTTDPDTRWEYCDVPECPVFPECRITQLGEEYRGTKASTASGDDCSFWDNLSHSQVLSLKGAMSDDDQNFCRNPDGREGGPWCYTSESDWEYCDVPYCKPSASCTREGLRALDYVGTKSITRTGRTCQRWDRQLPHSHRYTDPDFYPDSSVREAHNYCRNPDDDADRPWCYTLDPDIRWEYCDVPVCTDCKYSDVARGYAGDLSETNQGVTCQRWDSQEPHPHNMTDDSMFPDLDANAASNFCRNPDGKRAGPWCYTTNPEIEWQYCSIGYCRESTKNPMVRTKHVLHIGVDGLKPSDIPLAPGGAPNLLNRMRSEGSWTLTKGRTVIHTWSSPGWSAHLCGMDVENSGILQNTWRATWRGIPSDIMPVSGNDAPMHCGFATLKGEDNNLHTGFFHIWDWYHNMGSFGYPGAVDYEFMLPVVPEYDVTDLMLAHNVSTYLKDVLKAAPRTYTYVAFDETDYRGHSHGWGSPEYLQAIANIDHCIGIVLDALDEAGMADDVLVMIGTDHGGEGTSHGTPADATIIVPLFLRGPGVKEGYELQYQASVTDIIPTAAYALGIKGNPWWTGKPIREAFEPWRDPTRA